MPSPAEAAIRVLTASDAPVADRVRAAQRVAQALQADFRDHDAFRAACTVMMDGTAPVEVRIAAVNAVAVQGPAAPNQLVRVPPDDERRLVRAAATDALRRIGVGTPLKQRFEQDLRRASDPAHRVPVLANLAMTFGYDPRAIEVYRAALSDPVDVIRALAVRGLVMLGETDAVLGSAGDPSPMVRAQVAESLGHYSTLRDVEIRALGPLLQDAEATVQKAARTALRLMGIHPVAAPPARKKLENRTRGHGWRRLIEGWSSRALQDAALRAQLDDDVIAAGWLGFPPATDAQVTALEARIGKPLPPSYRQFLLVTNGLRTAPPLNCALSPAQDVDLFTRGHADWIAAWTSNAASASREAHAVYGEAQDPAVFHAEYLATAVQVSGVEDGAVYLLNPAITTREGEWEAWLFATWLPGARRYRSFRELMEHETGFASE